MEKVCVCVESESHWQIHSLCIGRVLECNWVGKAGLKLLLHSTLQKKKKLIKLLTDPIKGWGVLMEYIKGC